MKYSFNIQKEGIVLAQRYDIDASYKDMGAVCDAIRYLKANYALSLIDDIINKGRPIPYRRGDVCCSRLGQQDENRKEAAFERHYSLRKGNVREIRTGL